MTQRTAALLVLLLSVATLFGQTPLFAPASAPPEDPVHERVLTSAEKRMRLVQLVPNGLNGTIDLSLPLTIDLFDDVQYTVQLQRDRRAAPAGMEVWKGRVPDARFNHLPHYLNTLFVLNRNTGKLVVDIGTADGFFQVLPTARPGLYRIRDCERFGNERCATREPAASPVHPGSPLHPAPGARDACNNACDETDADGRFVIDVFAGYSESAAALAGDLEAHALANIETVNMGLANSLVDTVYLRLVGTGTTPNNPGVITSVLDDAWTWFAAQNEELAPDLIAVFQTPTEDPGSAGGWGGVPGRTTVNGVEWPTVFRHEAGHNAGGNHCYPDNENFRNGFDNGHWRTHLCGNDVNFYSNPWVNDDQGQPIGDTAQADMARQWTETAWTMANYNMHRVPYFEGDSCTDLPCLPSHWGDPIEYITHVQFNTLDNLQADPAWNCPAVTGFSDYTDLQTDAVQGATYDLLVESTASWEESTLRAWIDWNTNGVLGADELVMDMAGIGPWAAPVTVPAGAVPGAARMRIRLQYGLESPVDPCFGSGYSSGESEDYTVNLLPGNVGIGQPTADHLGLTIFPNPARNSVSLLHAGRLHGPVQVAFINAAGQRVLAVQRLLTAPTERLTIDVFALPVGLYACVLRTTEGIQMVRMVKE